MERRKISKILVAGILNSIFNNVYYNFNALKESDDSYSREDLKMQLQDLYIKQGNDWSGRGEAMDIAINAQIAAFEQILSEWEDEVR